MPPVNWTTVRAMVFWGSIALLGVLVGFWLPWVMYRP